MTQIIRNVTKTYQLITATCNILYNIDWIGNYTLHKITDQDIQYMGQARNLHEYLKRFEETVKDKIFKNIPNINSIKWNVKMFDENISLHLFVKQIGKIIEQFIKDTLTKQHPYYADYIRKHNIDFNKTIVVEITNNNKTLFVANLDIHPFL